MQLAKGGGLSGVARKLYTEEVGARGGSGAGPGGAAAEVEAVVPETEVPAEAAFTGSALDAVVTEVHARLAGVRAEIENVPLINTYPELSPAEVERLKAAEEHASIPFGERPEVRKLREKFGEAAEQFDKEQASAAEVIHQVGVNDITSGGTVELEEAITGLDRLYDVVNKVRKQRFQLSELADLERTLYMMNEMVHILVAGRSTEGNTLNTRKMYEEAVVRHTVLLGTPPASFTHHDVVITAARLQVEQLESQVDRLRRDMLDQYLDRS